MSAIDIVELSVDDWAIYKWLRLNALKDSPDSFGSTFSKEAGYSDQFWASRLDPISRSGKVLPLMAVADGDPCGMAWGLVHDPRSTIGHVYQMWVKPESRGMGIGRRLLAFIISWAQESNLRSLELSVTTTNLTAVSLYYSMGFVPSGEVEALRPGSRCQAQPMILKFHQDVA